MAYYQPLPQPTAALKLWDRCCELGAVLWRVISCLSEWVGKSIVDRYVERKRVCELRSLSDRTLKDLGIHRSEVLSVVHGKRFSPEDRRYEND